MSTLPNSLNRKIKEQIRDKISALSNVSKVYTFDRIPLEASPTVIVKYGNMEGEFWTTSENMRIYSYNIKVLVQIGNTPNDVTNDRLQQAEEEVAVTVEDIINVLDSNYELNQFNADVLFLDAVDMLQQEYQYEGGYAKGAELTVRVHTVFDV